jgi:hypothetical protein
MTVPLIYKEWLKYSGSLSNVSIFSVISFFQVYLFQALAAFLRLVLAFLIQVWCKFGPTVICLECVYSPTFSSIIRTFGLFANCLQRGNKDMTMQNEIKITQR